MSTEGVDFKSKENIKLQVVRQLSHESTSSSKDDIEETESRIEGENDKDEAIVDQISQLKGRNSDSIKDHEDDVVITKGNILFERSLCGLCMICPF